MARAGQTQGLGLLDRLYRFAGGLRSPGEIDIERPVAVMHDVSRGAELAQGFFFASATHNLIVGPSTTDRVALTRASIFSLAETKARGLGLTSDDSIWWMTTRLSSPSPNANLSFAWIGYVAGFTNDEGRLLAAFNNIEAVGMDPAADPPLTQIDGGASFQVPPTAIAVVPDPWPIELRGSNAAVWLMISSTAGGNLDVTARHVFYIGPKGTEPPRYTQ